MTIIDYINFDNIIVRFENGVIVKCTYGNFKTGRVKNPTDPLVLDKGCIGEGKYKHISFNDKTIPQYNTWYNMLNRCYNEVLHINHPTYKNCTVCDEWHNFQKFAKWYDENYYEIDGHMMHLDKDILVKGNKLYSPETCCFVPYNINTLFTKRNAKRGDFPIGVQKFNQKYQTRDRFQSSCNNGDGKNIFLGLYDSPEEAFEVYKEYKEKLIKQIADEYKDKIPVKLYDALYKYEVEITD